MKKLEFLCVTLFLCVNCFFFAQNYVFAQNSSSISPINCSEQTVVSVTKYDFENVLLSLPNHGQTQEEIFLEVVFSEGFLPQSAIPSIKVVTTQSPNGSKIDVLSGVPKTKFVFSNAGEYVLEVKTGYLLKST